MRFLYWLLLMVFLVGCNTPAITNHPKPNLQVDFSSFEQAGCTATDYGILLCEPGSMLFDQGCDRLEPVTDMLGGLTPAYPIASCIYIPMYRQEVSDQRSIPESEYFFNVGGPMSMLVRYLVDVGGEFQLIKNPGDFQAVFAPVESPEEALGFAIALLDIYPIYGLTFEQKLRYEVAALEDTYVEKTNNGYLVHAFDYQFFGCGPHYTYAVTVKVSTNGQVEELERRKIFRDPSMDDLCQD